MKRILSRISKIFDRRINNHVIDCDADPFVPPESEIESHLKSGQLHWKPSLVKLIFAPRQRKGLVSGPELREFLVGKPVLNANVLDYLLRHQSLIPKSWKKNRFGPRKMKFILFWGTVFRSERKYSFVRCLYWDKEGFGGRGNWVTDICYIYAKWRHYGHNSPAAIIEVHSRPRKEER